MRTQIFTLRERVREREKEDGVNDLFIPKSKKKGGGVSVVGLEEAGGERKVDEKGNLHRQ